MSTIIIILVIVIIIVVIYKLIANNYIKRMEDITNNGFAIIEITTSSYIGTLKT